ncbi:MAG: pitrilysin family protein [Anaerolineae bacterium]|nr:insulinase family protein [Anaerolineae bacterium]MDW7992922.1 pitrilysin family protein [Anaerolineae bacterium]
MSVLKTTLENGLTVLLKEVHTAPVTSFWIWYRVGSGHEHVGITGISHWVEHMLFKGTPRWPKGTADKAVSREGGMWNGATWYDFTTYYATLPTEKIALELDIEADRMTGALFEPHEVEAERTVIISERQGAENDPLFLLGEEVMAAAFRVHPYGHETLGHMCDLQSMTRDDLYRYYRTYYVPNNALAVAVGSFETQQMLDLIRQYFGNIPPGDLPDGRRPVEPPQRGERRVVVEGEGTTAYLSLVFHTPPATDPDFSPLIVLDTVLTGPSGMSLFGTGGTNKTSRLYRALVDTELAADVSGSLIPTVDPFVYSLTATVRPGRTPQEVEERLWTELEKVTTDLITEEELERSIKQARAQFAYSSESVTGQAFWLGWSEIFADYTWFENYLERLGRVTREDVLRVAQTYLRRSNTTVGWYIPIGNSGVNE